MIDYEYADLFYGSHAKTWIFIPNSTEGAGAFSNDRIVQDSISFDRGMCESSHYELGTYSAACLKVKVLIDDESERFKGISYIAEIQLDNHSENTFRVGMFTCVSDKLSSDRKSRELVMYDPLYELSAINVADWYADLYAEDGGRETITIFELRVRLFAECLGLEQESIELPNDLQEVHKVEYRTLSASALLKYILQANVCNCFMTNEGKVRYVMIRGYSWAGNVPFITPDITLTASNIYSCTYEEYQVLYADQVKIIVEAKRAIVRGMSSPLPRTNNTLEISYDNMLFRGLDDTEIESFLTEMVPHVLDRISFTPAEITLRGNPCYEPGDIVQVTLGNKTFYTVIIHQTMTGVQGLKMTLSARGDEKFSNPLSVESALYDDYAGSASQGSGGNADHSKTAWKLRSAPVDDETEERYYTYLTENKHFVVSNEADAGHSSENDRTEECTIGQVANPWFAGYFKNLFVNGEPVGRSLGTVCTKIDATLLSSGWTNGQQTITVSGIDTDETKQCIQISAPSANYQAFLDAQIMVVGQAANSLTFKSGNVPNANIDIYVVLFTVVEDAAQVSF